MARTQWPSRSMADRVKKSVAAKSQEQEEQAERQHIARRRAQGSKYCPNWLRGRDRADHACEVCPDCLECDVATQKRLAAINDHLARLFWNGCYNKDLWVGEIDLSEEWQNLDERLQPLMEEARTNPALHAKIKTQVDPRTHKALDQLVPGWKQLRQQPPRPNFELILQQLADIWHYAANEAMVATGCNDPCEAWRDYQHEGFFVDRRPTVRSLRQQLLDFCEQLLVACPKEFGRDPDKPLWPTKWMEADKGVRAMLRHRKHFVPLMNQLCKMHLDYDTSRILAEAIGAEPHRDKNGQPRELVLLPDGLDKSAMGDQLGVSASLVRDYLRTLADIGVLVQLRKPGPGAPVIYAIGYWHEWKKGRFRPLWFLTNTKEMRRKLASFNPYV